MIPQYPIRGGSAVLETQTALSTLLMGDEILKNLVPGRFYDGSVPPEIKARTPYGVIANVYERSNNRLTNVSREVTIELDLYSSYAGKTELANITDRIIMITEEQQNNFPMQAWVLNKFTYEGQQFFREAGIQRALLRFVATLEPRE